MVRPGQERLGGAVEVDETFLGGPEPGRPGRGALGKTMVEVAVEQDGTRLGRCRLAIIDDTARRNLPGSARASVDARGELACNGPAQCTASVIRAGTETGAPSGEMQW